MSEYTKGPWTVGDRNDIRNEAIVVRSDDWVIADVWADAEEIPAKANAQLIAAAPDLLEALKGVLPYMEAAEAAGLVGHEGCHWPVELVRAAIAKAVANE